MTWTRVFSRTTALLVAFTFLSERVGFATATPDAVSAKQQIEARGIGSTVKVQQTGGKAVRGTVVSIDEQGFMFQEKGKTPEAIPFAKVASVRGPGMSRGAKIGLGLGIGAAAFVVLLVIGAAHSVPG